MVGGTSVVALLDCGATHNFVSKALVKKLGVAPVLTSPMCITLADCLCVISHQVCTLSVEFNGALVSLPCQLVDSLMTPLALGMQLLEAVNPRVDWITKTVSWLLDG